MADDTDRPSATRVRVEKLYAESDQTPPGYPTLRSYVSACRESGDTWITIAFRLRLMDITVSHETLRTWFANLERD